LKILFVSDQYYPIGGGIEQYLRGLSRYVTGIGHDVVHLTRAIEGEPEREEWPDGLVLRSDLLVGAIREPQRVLDRWREWVPLIEEIAPDLVFANHHTSLAAIRAARALGLPSVYVCHGWGLLCPNRFRLLRPDPAETICLNERSVLDCTLCAAWKRTRGAPESKEAEANATAVERGLLLARTRLEVSGRRLARRAGWSIPPSRIERTVETYDAWAKILHSTDAIVSLSDMYRAFFDHANTHVVPLAVDEALYHPVDPKPFREDFGIRGPYVVVAGRIHHNKGQRWAVEALAELPEEVSLVLAGNTRLFEGDRVESNVHSEEVRRVIERLGVGDRVVFTGLLDATALRQAYSGALAALVPSIWAEPYGLVTLEAMSCACPVVVTSNTGSSEAVVDGWNGYVIERFDPGSLAAAVRKIAKQRDELGRRALQAVDRAHRWPVVGGRLLSLFEQLVADSVGAVGED
jgi:glycosyltransferase involved in cell wall biosynthesis